MAETYYPGITIRSARGVPADVRMAIRDLVRWLRDTLTIRHGVIVYTRPEEAVGAHGSFGFAAFHWAHNRDARHVWILLGGGVADLAVEEWGCTREDGLHIVRENLLHEFVHYEQWRDGREPTERGVNLRARSLLRRYYAERGMATPDAAPAGEVGNG